MITCILIFYFNGTIVATAKHYSLEGPAIETQWKRDFLRQSRPALRPNPFPVQWIPGPFPRGNAAAALDHTTKFNVEVKEQLSYTSTPLWAFMVCCTVNFSCTLMDTDFISLPCPPLPVYYYSSGELYSVILSVLDPRKCEYLKDYSLDFEHANMTTYLAS